MSVADIVLNIEQIVVQLEDEVVEKLIEQQGASGRMDQLKSDTIARHETLVEEKARLDLAYEEQLGGVDSELNKRRHDIDAFVKAEEESQQLMSERKARLDVASLTLTKAHIGLSELEQRLLSVPRIQLRGNIVRQKPKRRGIVVTTE